MVATRGVEKLTVFDPRGLPPKIAPKHMAPRLDTLDGKTVYLVDPRFDDSGVFLEQLQASMAEHMPRVKTKLVRLHNVYHHDDPKTWEEIRSSGHAAIIGVGH